MFWKRLEIKEAIFKTLVYADIFDYPPTIAELWRYLISSKPIPYEMFKEELKSLRIYTRCGRYFLGSTSIIRIIIVRRQESKKKLRKARKIANILFRIHTIELIGISGALAMNNSDKNDDIDFFIITSKKTLWITRLLVLMVLEFLGVRRKRQQQNVSDTICVNMFLTEEALKLPFVKRDLYTAHEIAQMKPLFDRNNMYKKFISVHTWVERYLPNALKHRTLRNNTRSHMENFSLTQFLVRQCLVFESLARTVQLFSIKRHKTTEIVSDSLLAFHPYDYRSRILKEYKRKLEKYEI